MLPNIYNFIHPTCVCCILAESVAVSADRAAAETTENKTVDGDSYVGNVNSYDGQAKLDRSNGNANDDDGVGLSVEC